MKKLILFWIFSGSLDGFSQSKIDLKANGWIVDNKPDTLPSKILISHKAPSFTHSIDGYCIYQGGVCAGKHLRYWRKRWVKIGPEYTVWGCKRVNAPKK